MKQLVVDAGPLIAFFYEKDIDHSICRAGFEQLFVLNTKILAPVPIVFEVYKWLMQRTSPVVAQSQLKVMRNVLEIVPLNRTNFEEVYFMVQALPEWRGSLEDATVIQLARMQRCPVWTLNHRDFGMFKSLEFWNPS